MTAQEIRRRPVEAPPLTELQKGLVKAGVRPFYTNDVKKYQREKIEELKRRKPGPVWGYLLAGCLLLAGFGFLLGFLLVQIPHFFRWESALSALWVAGMAGLFHGGVRSLIAGFAGRTRPSLALAWRSYHIGVCPAPHGSPYGSQFQVPNAFRAGAVGMIPIPREIQDIGNRVAATGVSAVFEVQQLDADPFLLVRSLHIMCSEAKEEYYIGVWDEKGFAG